MYASFESETLTEFMKAFEAEDVAGMKVKVSNYNVYVNKIFIGLV